MPLHSSVYSIKINPLTVSATDDHTDLNSVPPPSLYDPETTARI